jgi:hypothetical protein
MTLHTIGPKTIAEDERVIGKGYQSWPSITLIAAPLVAAHYLDVKWVAAIGLGSILLQLHEINGRLHDLCIRLRRTNLLLAPENSN